MTPDTFVTLANNDIISLLPGKLADYRFVINENNIANERMPGPGQGTTSQPVPLPGCSRSQNPQNSVDYSMNNRKRTLEDNEESMSEQPGCSKLRKVADEGSGLNSQDAERTDEALTQPIQNSVATTTEASIQNENVIFAVQN